METFKISGKITDSDGNPVPHALVRFIGDLPTLGGMPGAVVSARTAIVWRQEIDSFAGHRWNAYRKFVVGRVAGMTFADFKQQVVEHNPSLVEDDYVFQKQKRYSMPENDPAALEISWDRALTDFYGNRWQCWNAFVAGKVIGMTWSLLRTRWSHITRCWLQTTLSFGRRTSIDCHITGTSPSTKLEPQHRRADAT